MKHEENHNHRRYYERFQVEDVINFFSGQLLQAKSSDGAQVFLQRIKYSRRPLPEGFSDALCKLQHSNLAPVLDVLEEEDQLILVHPPFSGDPLPLVVNKDEPMESEKAIRIANKCFRTLMDLEQLPLPLQATLDPKNILLDGNQPLLLFYYIKDSKPSSSDEKWRELLFFLLAGQTPQRGQKQHEKQLEEKRVPSKIMQIALRCLDQKFTIKQLQEMMEQYIKANDQVKSGLSRGAKQRKNRKSLYTTVALATAALVLVSITVSQISNPGNGIASNSFFNLFQGDSDKEVKPDELYQSFHFTDQGEVFTFDEKIVGNTSIRGEFELKTLNGFQGIVETVDQSVAFGIQIDKEGKINVFQKLDDKQHMIDRSGDLYRVQPGKKYTFEIFHFPNQPLRLYVSEEGQVKKWLNIGKFVFNKEFTLRFEGGSGSILYVPQIYNVSNHTVVDNLLMNQQPWRLDYGQGLIDIDDQGQNHLLVYSKSKLRIDSSAASNFIFMPPKKGDLLHMDLEMIDGARYRLNLAQNHLALTRNEEKIKEQEINWNLNRDQPVQMSIITSYNTIKVKVTQGSYTTEVEYNQGDAFGGLRDATLYNDHGFTMIQNPKE
ncbi:hypothetical protein [Hazenella coriacea]|uniref:Uncharacterized protein n=1 Tax=Hazenella coriacea TaxID=1179467 RepID=A0A4R3L9N6_9BACL|nr:hypothetical protein [Hazenella coriacea]TCS96419.1 hypothetical protein EDD58_10150 [Hazenella coriacea]